MRPTNETYCIFITEVGELISIIDYDFPQFDFPQCTKVFEKPIGLPSVDLYGKRLVYDNVMVVCLSGWWHGASSKAVSNINKNAGIRYKDLDGLGYEFYTKGKKKEYDFLGRYEFGWLMCVCLG